MHFTRNNNVNTLYSNPEIPGFGLSKSRDFGIEKRSGIPGSWDSGLQSLALLFKGDLPVQYLQSLPYLLYVHCIVYPQVES